MNSRKVFVDSSIIVEYFKGSKTELLDYLLNEAQFQLYISQIVVSESLFHALAVYGEKSPLSIKMAAKISEVLINHKPHSFLSLFEHLPDYPELLVKAAELMQNYNLLPNDALIIGICLHHKIKHVISFDKNDLEKVCLSEGLNLIGSVEALHKTEWL